MRVLIAPAHVFLSPRSGSEPGRVYSVIAKLAKNYNIKIDAVCGGAAEVDLPPNVRLFKVGFGKLDTFYEGLFFFKLYAVSKDLVKEVDVVHHMAPIGFRVGLNPLAIFGRLRDKPFVFGPIQHPQVFADITDHQWVSGRRGLKALLTYNIEKALVGSLRKPLEVLHVATLNEAEALIFDSEKTLELYRVLYPDVLSGKTLEVIPQGVDVEQFSYVPPIKKDYFEILTVAYLQTRKGIQFLIKAMSAIVKEFGNVKLKVVGDGPYKEDLLRLTKQLSLEKYVEFAGYVPRNELSKVYANCDIYVQPSLSESTLTNAAQEAMAVGRPVIATDVGTVGEFLKDGLNGFLVPPKDPGALAVKIVELLRDEDLRIKVGREARKYVETCLNWNTLADKYYRIYENLAL